MIERIITAPDGHEIQVKIWPNEHGKAWVHLHHGMAEHIDRYDAFAQQLVKAGYAVLGHNHRGHGSSATTQQGLYGSENGWLKVLQDISTVREDVCNDDRPYYIFAHSMGSFICQAYLTREDIPKPGPIKGLILSGSNLQSPFLSKAGLAVASMERMRLGKQGTSKLINFLSFGSFNNAFKPARTDFDWLSRDPEQVDLYVKDDLCGFDCSAGLWCDLLVGLGELYGSGNLKHFPTEYPVYIFGGDKDPVGLMGKGLPKLAQAYKAAGNPDVTMRLYENGRHEMLNETNKQQVMDEVIDWLNAHCQSEEKHCA